MKTKNDAIWKTVITLILLALLVMMIMVLKKVKCLDCNNMNKASNEKVLIIKTSEEFDSVTNRKKTTVWIDTLLPGEKGNSSVVIWNDCPSKPLHKRSTKPKMIKAKENVPIVNEQIPVQADTSNYSVSECYIDPDTLKLEVSKKTSDSTFVLFSQVNVLPFGYDGGNKTQFNYDVVADLHIKEYIKKAKTHLWIGTGAASLGALTYTATMLVKVPTFVEYNGLGYFDPANKYYDHNVYERKRLNNLKWARGISVGVGVLGGLEIIHGIILLKNAEVTIDPQQITLKYSF